MEKLLIGLLIIVMVATFIALTTGLIYLLGSSNTSRRNSNRLMQWRVILQAIALLIFSAIIWRLKKSV